MIQFRKVSILGSTGSIGTQAIDVCRELGYKVVGLAASQNTKLLALQVKQLSPEKVCIFNSEKALEFKQQLINIDVDISKIQIVTGMEGLCEIATIDSANIVLNAVVGMVGLQPTLAAISAKKNVALANKETLVTGGKLVMEQARMNSVSVFPVDSEHSAIFQALQGNDILSVKKLILTASGGPFFGKTREQLEQVTVKEALNHPNWSMGNKVTIDSATLMNKGLELIEACWLFDKSPSQIEIVVHRESVIHSLVEYIDNAVIAQLGVPDMKIPIQYALTYPDRVQCKTRVLSLTDYTTLSFAKPDIETFICLKACIKAANQGGLSPTVVNGANEQAVTLFLDGKIKFTDIGQLVMSALQNVEIEDDITLDGINRADKAAREYVMANIIHN